jgi:hypothetical protein
MNNNHSTPKITGLAQEPKHWLYLQAIADGRGIPTGMFYQQPDLEIACLSTSQWLLIFF